MIDDHLIDSMSPSLRLQLHKPVRRNVALVTDEPWEGNACLYNSIFQDENRYRMYFDSQQYVNSEKNSFIYTNLTPVILKAKMEFIGPNRCWG